MIQFDVENNDGDRTLYLEGSRVLVGWIERGRTIGTTVEWAFTPNHPTAPRGNVSLRGISPAYEDARKFVAEYLMPGGPIYLDPETGEFSREP